MITLRKSIYIFCWYRELYSVGIFLHDANIATETDHVRWKWFFFFLYFPFCKQTEKRTSPVYRVMFSPISIFQTNWEANRWWNWCFPVVHFPKRWKVKPTTCVASGDFSSPFGDRPRRKVCHVNLSDALLPIHMMSRLITTVTRRVSYCFSTRNDASYLNENDTQANWYLIQCYASELTPGPIIQANIQLNKTHRN